MRTERRRAGDKSSSSVLPGDYGDARAMTTEPPTLRVRNDELRTVRQATREFGTMLAELDAGGVEKLVLTQGNRMRAVVVSVERWSELERALGAELA